MRIFGKGLGVYRILRECCIFPQRGGDSLSAPLFSIFFWKATAALSKNSFFQKASPPTSISPKNIVSALFDGKLVLMSVRNKSCSKEHVSISQMERSHKSNCVLTTMRSGIKRPHFGVLLYFFFYFLYFTWSRGVWVRWAINIGLKGIWTAGGSETGMEKKESSLGFPFEIQAVWEIGVSEKKTF